MLICGILGIFLSGFKKIQKKKIEGKIVDENLPGFEPTIIVIASLLDFILFKFDEQPYISYNMYGFRNLHSFLIFKFIFKNIKENCQFLVKIWKSWNAIE